MMSVRGLPVMAEFDDVCKGKNEGRVGGYVVKDS